MAILLAGRALAAPVQPPIIPTVHPVLTPASAVALPLRARANHSDVWLGRSGHERMVLRGHVVLHVAYRTLHADQAVIWLRPQSGAGLPVYRVWIYLVGHVRVVEGAKRHTVTTAQRLMVTGRVMHSVQLSGTRPISRNDKRLALVLAGQKLRVALARQRRGLPFIPTVTVQPTEMALQQGWIARGPGNSIIYGPGQILPRTGNVIIKHPVAVPARLAVPAPLVFATGDRVDERTIAGRRVVIVHGSFYMIRQTRDGKPPLQLRAQNAVLFSPGRAKKGAAAGPRALRKITRVVTGVYLQGDVSITYGVSRVHANRIFYDFTHNQAIMINAVLSTEDQAAALPLYMRAKEILQAAQGDYVARTATLSTDEFYTPHYDIAASRIALKDITPRTLAGRRRSQTTYAITARNMTLRAENVPFFYLPYFAADTSNNNIPIRSISAGYSNTYGGIIGADWDLFGLLGRKAPRGVHADLKTQYFTNRGPAGGVNARWLEPNQQGYLRSFGMKDNGTDILGRTRSSIAVPNSFRGRVLARDSIELPDNWLLQLQGSYISDPNFLEQYFNAEYAVGTEQQTSAYVRHISDTSAETLVGKFNLNNFIANADLEDNEFTVQKEPEAHYWRLGDSILGLFTYYSDTSGGLVKDNFSRTTPAYRGLQANFPGMPANQQFVTYYMDRGWTQNAIARGDTRQELDLPLDLGQSAKIVPYAIGRYTFWDSKFPVGQSGVTNRFWGALGLRGSMDFWKVYNNVNSHFWDVHGLRHIIEPQVNVFFAGSNVQQGNLQPFDSSVEGITDASGAQFALRQKLETKRGKPGHRYTVDWMSLNVSADMFWHQSPVGPFSATNPVYAGGPFSTSNYSPSLIGQFYNSRPELSIPTDSINANGSWRVGDYTRFLADESWNVDHAELEQADAGVLVNQSPALSYFVGNRYIQGVYSDQWTVGMAYRLTRKYAVSATQSYDFYLGHNILSTVTISRRLPRLFVGLTLLYNADQKNTGVVVNVWPQGLKPPGRASNALLGLPY